jgi:hypothetical protein
VEPEGERFNRYQWPYSGNYSIYRESVNYEAIQSLSIWCNDLHPGKEVQCHLTPIRALPLLRGRLINPRLEIGNCEMMFPVEIEAGGYLELDPEGDCAIYGPEGELVQNDIPTDSLPLLRTGDNRIRFACEETEGTRPRARVTLWTHGQPVHRL